MDAQFRRLDVVFDECKNDFQLVSKKQKFVLNIKTIQKITTNLRRFFFLLSSGILLCILVLVNHC